jgi:hypothetical protein
MEVAAQRLEAREAASSIEHTATYSLEHFRDRG